MLKKYFKIFAVGLLCITTATQGVFAWKSRTEEYLASFLAARKYQTPVSNIISVLLPNCVSKTVQLYEKKSAQLLVMVSRIDQQLEFLCFRKKHSLLGRLYQLPTKWLTIMCDKQFQENVNELRMLKKKYITLLGALSNAMQAFPTDTSSNLVSAWVSSVLGLIDGKPVTPIEKFEQLHAIEDRIKKSMIQEQKFVVSVTGDAVVSSCIETGTTWTRRVATTMAIVAATYYAYRYCNQEAVGSVTPLPSGMPPASDPGVDNPEPTKEDHPVLKEKEKEEGDSLSSSSDDVGSDTEQSSGAWFPGWMGSYPTQSVTESNTNQTTEEKSRVPFAWRNPQPYLDEVLKNVEGIADKVLDGATERVGKTITETIPAMVHERYVSKVRGTIFNVLAKASLAGGAGVAYWYVKRAMSKHGGVYMAMKKNFQDMIYILSAYQTPSLQSEQLGNVIYISKQLSKHASNVLSYDEIQLLERDLRHITDPSIPTISKLETLKFMQKSYSFLGQKQAIII